jgi:1-acyl-sn-glycerol-3-phosphate acyltransferase
VTVLRNLLFYAAFYLGSVYFVLGSLVAMATVSEERFRKFPNAWSNFHRWCVNHILGIDVRVEGMRPEGQSFFAIKHESFFEAIDLATMLDEPVPYAKEELFRIPGWGRVARAYGGIAVAREAGAKGLRSMLTESRKHIDSGRQLAIFPEGKRVPHGTRPPLRAGFAGLYKLLRLPVVPVAVDSGPIYQRLWKPRGTITIRFGQPIPPGLPREELEARVHAAINELNS